MLWRAQSVERGACWWGGEWCCREKTNASERMGHLLSECLLPAPRADSLRLSVYCRHRTWGMESFTPPTCAPSTSSCCCSPHTPAPPIRLPPLAPSDAADRRSTDCACPADASGEPRFTTGNGAFDLPRYEGGGSAVEVPHGVEAAAGLVVLGLLFSLL